MRLNRCNECKADIEEGFPMISWFRYGPVREDQPKVMHFCSDLCEAKNAGQRVIIAKSGISSENPED